MEFKGTKGKWMAGSASMRDTNKNELVVFPELKVKYKDGYRLICCISPIDLSDKEDMANARLISKAPEMLEMLNNYLSDLTNIVPQSPARDNRIKQVEQLIKSATELKEKTR